MYNTSQLVHVMANLETRIILQSQSSDKAIAVLGAV